MAHSAFSWFYWTHERNYTDTLSGIYGIGKGKTEVASVFCNFMPSKSVIQEAAEKLLFSLHNRLNVGSLNKQRHVTNSS